MNEREFNLLDEPWIIVLNFDGSTEKVSLIDALARAAEFRGLAGELPTQDAAILRLLLAVLHTVIARYGPSDDESEHGPIMTSKQALRYWDTLWKQKSFPMQTIRKYLDKYHDRFYLFDPEHPFFQVKEPYNGTEFSVSKLNGEISESGNKVRIFAPQKADRKLEYDEAARWLIHLNAYDDSAVMKAKDKKDAESKESPGSGWLGKIGLVMADGDNLFETLTLNMVLLREGTSTRWEDECPIWEVNDEKLHKRRKIPYPQNLSELYTLQSRRIKIRRDDNGDITGYVMTSGDFFDAENMFTEQMTLWKKNESKHRTAKCEPLKHNPTVQLWRNFSALLSSSDGCRPVGVVSWLAKLQNDGILANKNVRLKTAAVKYDGKGSSIIDLFVDDMEFSCEMLEEKGDKWVPAVIKAIEMAEALAKQTGYLAKKIAEVCGARSKSGDEKEFGKVEEDAAKEKAYSALDMPFRTWLAGINPECEMTGDAIERWWNIAQPIIRRIGAEIIVQAGPQALVSKRVKGKYMAGVERYNYFLYRTKNWQTLLNGGKTGGK